MARPTRKSRNTSGSSEGIDPANAAPTDTSPSAQSGKATPTGDYEVGYGRPPVRTQFQSGRSGNPKGRRKGSNNLKTDVVKVLRTPIKLTDNGKPQKVSTQYGSLMRLRERALKGDPRSLDLLLKYAVMFNNDADAVEDDALSADDAEILEYYLERRVQEALAGKAPPKRSPKPRRHKGHRPKGHSPKSRKSPSNRQG